jgi:hypothetical protein
MVTNHQLNYAAIVEEQILGVTTLPILENSLLEKQLRSCFHLVSGFHWHY